MALQSPLSLSCGAGAVRATPTGPRRLAPTMGHTQPAAAPIFSTRRISVERRRYPGPRPSALRDPPAWGRILICRLGVDLGADAYASATLAFSRKKAQILFASAAIFLRATFLWRAGNLDIIGERGRKSARGANVGTFANTDPLGLHHEGRASYKPGEHAPLCTLGQGRLSRVFF